MWLSRRHDLDTMGFFDIATDAFEPFATRSFNDPRHRDHIARHSSKQVSVLRCDSGGHSP